MIPRFGRLRLLLALVLLTGTGCSDATCTAGGIIAIDLTVTSATGQDLTAGVSVVLKQVAGPDAGVGDSLYGSAAIVHAVDSRPGTFLLKISHDGYVTQEKSVTVPLVDGECGRIIQTQQVTVVLAAVP